MIVRPALVALALTTSLTVPAVSQTEGTGGRCVPVSERAGRELGCFILSSEDVGAVGTKPVFWHLTSFDNRADAEKASAGRGTIHEGFGKTWLFTLGDSESRVRGGKHVAAIGPIPVDSKLGYTAQYMEAVFKPGMKSRVHRHAGPEAWFTLAGETCLETPTGKMVGKAGGANVIVPSGPPMELTATGTSIRKSFVLILHETRKPHTSPADDWTPKGLCSR